MQQIGRGLGRSSPTKILTVIDYAGNHKVFLLKPRTLFRLGQGREVLLDALRQLRDGVADLPPGCEVTYELEAIDILKRPA
jgi:hypothetical protein